MEHMGYSCSSNRVPITKVDHRPLISFDAALGCTTAQRIVVVSGCSDKAVTYMNRLQKFTGAKMGGLRKIQTAPQM